MKRKNRILAALAALLACALAGAAAQAEEGPCKADIEKFCKDVQPGEGRIVNCLKKHEAGLSAGCKAKGVEVKEKIEQFKEVCQADLDKFCKDVQPGEGRLAKCLKEHEAGLSDPCAKKIAEEREDFIKGHPCVADMEKFCKDVQPGEGRKMKCIKEHETDLSGACKIKMAEAQEIFLTNHPCMADMEKFCKGVQSGEGRKIRCIKEHEAELSEACKAKIAAAKEDFKKKNPCGTEIEKFCGDIQAGEGRIIACLKAHEAELSAECKAKGYEVKEKVVRFLEVCQADMDKFCKDVNQGEGRIVKCLKEHEKEVSDGCRTEIAGKKQKEEKRKK